MSVLQQEPHGDRRLRFVFDDSVLSFTRAADITLGDIARTLGELSPRRYGHPIAIDLVLGPGEHRSPARSTLKE